MPRKSAVSLLLALSLLCLPSSLTAQETPEHKLKKIQEELGEKKKKLGEIKRKETSVLGELDRTNSELLGVKDDLREQEDELARTGREVAAVKKDMAELEARLGKRKDWMKRKLRAVHRYGNMGDAFLLIGSAENVSQLMRRLEYLSRLAKHENGIIEDFKADLRALFLKKESLNDLYARQKRQEDEIKKAEEGLQKKKRQKEELLASVKKEKTSYEQLIREMEEASDKLMEMIKKADAEDMLVGGGFRGTKGHLGWPVTGELAVPYGKQKDKEYGTTVFRNGIHIKTSARAVARAVHRGKVVFAEWFKGYGKLVIVNHGDGYHSLYANLAEIFLRNGDIIKKDADIGRVGESVIVSAPSLYFEVRYKGKPLDPMQWLKAR